ncbi:acetyl-CoA synthetase-like protein [Thozetella sp. PMI_491]|nr:acetyl-CoA synthetase-like protein [Thozetella sp. PMI_491]
MNLRPVPISPAIAVPAVAGAAAYLNARLGLSYDTLMLRSIIPPTLNIFWRERQGSLNQFYLFESLATSKSSASRCFLRFEDKTYTYAESYDLVLRYAGLLKTKYSVKKGEIVALNFQNTDAFAFLILALWSLGAAPAFINYNLTGAALAHCIKRSTSRLMLIDPLVAPNVTDEVQREFADVSFHVFTSELEEEGKRTAPYRAPDDDRYAGKGSDKAILIYTSGTTGMPKAAIVGWAKVWVVAGFTRRWIGTTTKDVYYTSMPLYHSTAMLMAFSHVICAGATLALGRKFSTTKFWSEVRKHDATIIQYVGETCRYLLSAPPAMDPATGEDLDRKHRVRVALGNGLRPDVWNRFKERFGIEAIAEFYGATEGNFATWNLSKNDFSMGAVGRNGSLYNLSAGRNLALVEIDYETDQPFRNRKTGLCNRVPDGKPGELLFRLPPNDVTSRFQGYYGDAGATTKKIMRDVFVKGDAWFRTGDVVKRENGLVYFSDRLGDTFRWKSENVSTAEVAQVVGLHPAIMESNVYGVSLPHHEGRAGCAAVVLDPAVLTSEGGLPSKEFLKSLADHVRRGLPRYALPIFIRVSKEGNLMTTGTNKQQKNVLRDQGVDPAKIGDDKLYWLRKRGYEPFGEKEWKLLNGSKVKL